MRPSTRNLWGGGIAVLLVALAGCSKTSSALAEVSGTVTLDGKPLSGVVVTFYPVGDTTQPRKPYSKGTTDETGKFTLTCEGEKPGAVVGKHKVTVNWPTQYERGAPPKTPPIPLPYTIVSTTQIEKDVAAGPNTIAVEMVKQ